MNLCSNGGLSRNCFKYCLTPKKTDMAQSFQNCHLLGYQGGTEQGVGREEGILKDRCNYGFPGGKKAMCVHSKLQISKWQSFDLYNLLPSAITALLSSTWKTESRIQEQPATPAIRRLETRPTAVSSSSTARCMAQGHRHPYALLNSSMRWKNNRQIAKE